MYLPLHAGSNNEMILCINTAMIDDYPKIKHFESFFQQMPFAIERQFDCIMHRKERSGGGKVNYFGITSS